jgi:hypothetical protein
MSKQETKWYQNAESDWALIMEVETDRIIKEIEIDGMGFPIAVRPEDVATKVVKDLIRGLILKPTGSSKWMKSVEKDFHEVYGLSRDYILQAELKGIVPKVYTINNLT